MTSTDQREADATAVAGLTRRMVAAWSNHDPDAFAALFTEDGTMILPGLFRNGREEIRSYMADAFENEYKDSQVTGQPLDLRFLSADIAVLLTEGGVIAPGTTEVGDDRAIRATWLAVKQDGEWRLAAYQNTPRN
ncbi:MAG: SgcJ/EcaC family oxidoreductase [Frankiaceae bacterium]